ncbi:DUF4198 domain-containing protein [Sagittula salina]|uniref:DUF4198 domain-containing protein n=1 Tax=Sagittula salina TaxID=2820268 RepID=A0A940MR51_9RHOB|nr:DUF4198 domain-containing protein [Sagittula salina]MBP0482532.1 DUF4198 domain-containing protein [Sagittula salina]
MRLGWVALVLYAMGLQPVRAHEFWIEPEAYVVAPDTPVVARLKVGDRLKGASSAYVPPNFRRFDVIVAGEVIPVQGRPGDMPALNMVVGREGLATVVHVTRDYTLTYKDRATFERFCDHKDIGWACAAHDGRGLDHDIVREQYTRFAKSLVALGEGRGSDAEVGLETEIVAEANPYTDDLSDGFPIRVLYEGAPRGDAQVEVFDKSPDGTVDVRLYRTDAEGRTVVDVTPGHAYLLDAVTMLELPVQGDGPAWSSRWASLTFAVPQ